MNTGRRRRRARSRAWVRDGLPALTQPQAATVASCLSVCLCCRWRH